MTGIVPVSACSADRRTKIDTYKILDEQSDSSFLSDEMMSQLRLNGVEVQLKLTTMTSTDTISYTKISNLEFYNYTNQEQSIIVPTNRNQILRKNKLKKIPRLNNLIDKIPESIQDLEIGLLIGTNCLPALEPTSVVYDPEYHCYGIRSQLGWSCVGVPNEL